MCNSDSSSAGSGQEWPKPWSGIKEPVNPENKSPFKFSNPHLELMDGLRGYDGTLYLSVDIGHETDENRDLWVPFDIYLQRYQDTDS